MACLFTEGFDKYGAATVSGTRLTTLLSNEWTTVSGTPVIVAPLSSLGQALRIPGSGFLKKTLAANYARLIGGVRMSSTNGGSVGVTFMDGATAQGGFSISSAGVVTVRSGSTAVPTVLGTAATPLAADSTHYIEWDFEFADAGTQKLWIDGVLVINVTPVDMKISANAYANIMNIDHGASGVATYDDIYLFDTTTAFCAAVLNTNPVVETRFPTSDTATSDFAFGAGFVGKSESTGGSSSAPGVTVYLKKITPVANCTLNSVSQMPAATSAGAKFKAVLYSDTAGAADALLATGTETVGTVSGTAFTAPFGAGQALTGGTSYWIGFITDTSVTIASADATLDGVKKTNTYASGAPNPLSGQSTGQTGWQIWGNVTAVAVNYLEVNNQPPGPADASYVSSSTVGNEDLFNLPTLSFVPAAIYALSVKIWGRDTDSGVRTVTPQMKSAGTDSAGAAQTPATTYGWLSAYYPTDPNTAIAWTYAGANAATPGYKIAS
jgi:hypothetical protein